MPVAQSPLTDNWTWVSKLPGRNLADEMDMHLEIVHAGALAK